MTMTQIQFLNALVPHLNVNFDWKTPGEEVEIKESGHVQHGKTIRKLLSDYLGEENTKKINDHFGYDMVEEKKFPVPPVQVLFLAHDKMTIEENIRKDGTTGSNKALADILYNNAKKKEP